MNDSNSDFQENAKRKKERGKKYEQVSFVYTDFQNSPAEWKYISRELEILVYNNIVLTRPIMSNITYKSAESNEYY